MGRWTFHVGEAQWLQGLAWFRVDVFGTGSAGKFRPIDALSESLVNEIRKCPEQVKVGGVDRIAAVATSWARMLEHESVEVTLRTGDSCYDGEVHLMVLLQAVPAR